jgi:hypothetical protein
MTSKQLREAEVYESLEPYGTEHDYLQAAIICSILANVNRDSKKKPKPYEPKDFMPHWYTGGTVTRKQTTKQIGKILSGMASKKVKRKK